MELIEYAKQELEKAGYFSKDSDYSGMIGEAIMELIEVFSKQEHSGMSASVVLSLFNKVARYEPILGIIGGDDEWNEVGEEVYQNKRISAVFKDGKEGRPYYLDAIVFTDQDGISFTSGGSVIKKNGEVLQSRQYIKSFPFLPKTFYVDVLEPEDREECSVLRDENQLKEVFDYYDEYKVEEND